MRSTITITGRTAREIDQHTTIYVRPERRCGSYTEVQGMDECRHGCKLYVRQRGAVRQYAVLHSASYGCALGRDEATRTVRVSVRPSAS